MTPILINKSNKRRLSRRQLLQSLAMDRRGSLSPKTLRTYTRAQGRSSSSWQRCCTERSHPCY
ncbi:hypothetical protein BD311DRAFT_769849 [Dichomitus squalens]|uniref:Uncharacterized protein n=1 Tax=Dichomitus squalens TaxID=114155 RepID=A0A4Q9M6X4_9APHY|nr:hypothetical protein BD311DRAFT_769849 [Dichomitus squalens]